MKTFILLILLAVASKAQAQSVQEYTAREIAKALARANAPPTQEQKSCRGKFARQSAIMGARLDSIRAASDGMISESDSAVACGQIVKGEHWTDVKALLEAKQYEVLLDNDGDVTNEFFVFVVFKHGKKKPENRYWFHNGQLTRIALTRW
jgi:hypothetical protein